MQSVAEPWLVLSIGGSSFLLGLDAFAMNAPFWILALLGGVLADRADRTLIIYFFQGIQMLCPVLIVALVAMGWVKVWMIIACPSSSVLQTLFPRLPFHLSFRRWSAVRI